MNLPFPFGFPWPTAFYLTTYVLTFVSHVVFMHYVIAGTCYLVTVAVRNRPEDPDRRAALLRDWMPLMLSGVITAGVAPLLFIQILYRNSFYTANLLLFHRWMAIVPALIVGFYLLYLLKSPLATRRGMWLRVTITIGAFACFFFTGWSWTENHLLSLQSTELWAEHYAQGRMQFWPVQLIPRMAAWFSAAFPTLAVWLAWQIRLTPTPTEENHRSVINRLALTAWVGMGVGVIAGALLLIIDPPAVRSAVLSPFGLPWLIGGAVGLAVQSTGWWRLRSLERLDRTWLTITTAGVGLTILSGAVVREVMRIARIDIDALYRAHADAAGRGGLFVFLFFFVLNIGIIAYCIRLVSRKAIPNMSPGDTKGSS
ncbi:hypothetical protein Mal4_11770 [Maioricimonas rarisocia]|uniref:Uncharacterized protein n=1 Tax=Maioricimonas rarisocia TaxID=2528026 RepID=A0A517Z360_9PLAN|nr:hypothetical protein [Maioricimonas rarisocia]QDU36876.1 hypothetical protein Mal4_11770 [Maioricimonas rarisocia]